MRGCLQIIREQIRKAGEKKHSGARQDPYLLGRNVRGSGSSRAGVLQQRGPEAAAGRGGAGALGTGEGGGRAGLVWASRDGINGNLALPGRRSRTKSSPI